MKKFNYLKNGLLTLKTFDSISDLFLDAFGKNAKDIHFRFIIKEDGMSNAIVSCNGVRIEVRGFVPGDGEADVFEDIIEEVKRIG